jgi:hypothetical protein
LNSEVTPIDNIPKTKLLNQTSCELTSMRSSKVEQTQSMRGTRHLLPTHFLSPFCGWFIAHKSSQKAIKQIFTAHHETSIIKGHKLKKFCVGCFSPDLTWSGSATLCVPCVPNPNASVQSLHYITCDKWVMVHF